MKKVSKSLFILVVGFILIFALSCSHEHTWDEGTITIEATCTTSGLKIFHCTQNGCGVTREEQLPLTGHIEVIDQGVDATCSETGLTEGSHCSHCGTVIKDQVIIPTLNHVEVIDPAVAPTCVKKGLSEGSHCSLCNMVIVEQVEQGELIDHNFVNGICTMCGSTDFYTVELRLYLNTEGTGYIVNGGGYDLTEIIIPTTYKGLPVVEIGEGAFNNYVNLSKITIPDTIKVIKENAFFNCDALTEITLPKDLEVIGEKAFFNCDNLASITIPSKVTSITNTSFRDCPLLTTIIVDENNTVYDSRNNCNAIIETATNKVIKGASSTIIPDGIVTIGEGAFSNLNNLVSIIIPTSVKTIEEYAFFGCRALVDVYYIGSASEWESINIHNTNDETLYTIAKITHNYLHTCQELVDPAVKATCTESGLTEGKHCSICNKVIVAQNVIEPLGHTEVIDPALAPTCTKTGLTEGKHCSVCNEKLVAQEEIAATGVHTEVIDAALAPTCENTGLTEGKHCSVCNGILVAQETISAIGHKYEVVYNWNEIECEITLTCGNDATHVIKEKMEVKENIITAPTCLEDGLGDYVATYTVNDVTYTDKITITLKALGHNEVIDAKQDATCQAEGLTEGKHCGRCNEVLVKQEKIEKIECNFVDGECLVCHSTDVYTKNLLFTLNDEGTSYSVSKGTCTEDTIVIPANYKGLPVTVIENDAFKDCTHLSSITIGKNVEIIGKNAFLNCTKLVVVVVPENVKEIGFAAFSGCTNIAAITLPFIGNKLNGEENTHLSYIFGAETYYDSSTYMPTNLVDVILSGSEKIDDYAFANCNSLETIAMGYSVKTIGKWAFSMCTSLDTIALTSSLKNIDEAAFNGCGSIVNVCYYGTIEDWCNITFEDEFANPMKPAANFMMCDEENNLYQVKKIEIPGTVETIGKYQFYGFDNLTSVKLSEGTTTVEDSAFDDCELLKTITLPGSVNKLGLNAFSNCPITNIYYDGKIEDWCSLPFTMEDSITMKLEKFYMLDSNNEYYLVTNLEIPSTVTSIGDFQFLLFKQLETVTIAEGVTSIGSYAFYGCNNLTSISIPNSITKIGDYAFTNCNSLQYTKYENANYIGSEANPYSVLVSVIDKTVDSFIINENTKIINSQAFMGCSNLKSIKIPNNVVGIGLYAFYGCASLESVEISNSVLNIGQYAFYNCSSLTSFDIPDNIKNIDYGVFAGCSSLTNIEIPNGVTTIGTSAFSNCILLESVKIPESVTSIEDYAFSNCSSLNSITIPSKVSHLGESVFSNCEKLVNVYYDGTLEDWCNFVFENENSNPMTYATSFFIKNSSNEYEEVKELVISDDIIEIGAYQFVGFDNLVSVKLPDTIVSIGKGAFSNCTSLTNVEFGNAVKNIDESAFAGCSSLTEIKLPNSLENIGQYAFKDCNLLESITIPFVGKEKGLKEDSKFSYIFGQSYSDVPATLKEVVITNCEEIYDNAFNGCSTIETIILPDTLSYIGLNVFNECTALKYNTYENGLYLGSANNPYFVLVSVVDNTVVEFNIHEDTKIIYTKAFDSCFNLEELVISNNVVNIGFGAFNSCYSLKSLTLPFIGETINDENNNFLCYMFGGESTLYTDRYVSSKLTSVTITGDVEVIGYNAFENIKTLKSIIIPDTVKVIEGDAFAGCTGLTTFTLPASLEKIGSYIFNECTNLVDVYYNNTLENWCKLELSSSVMAYTQNVYMLNEENEYYEVLEVVIPDSITEVGNYQFAGFNSIVSLFIHSGVTKIGEDAFFLCTSLETVTFDDSYTEIGYNSFYNCSSLIELNLGKNIVSIDNRAFYNCSSLTTVVVPESVEIIGYESFYTEFNLGSSLESITLPFIGKTREDLENNYFAYIFGSVYQIPESLKEIIITDCKDIPENAFYNCSNVIKIVFPSDVTSIGEKAFGDCRSLTEIIIPDTVTSIGKNAFSGCSQLESITLPFVGSKPNTSVNSSFSYVFGGVDNVPQSLKTVTITGGETIGVEAFRKCNSIESIILNGITNIGVNAFSSCDALKDVTFGIDLKKVDFNAFYDCDALTNVNYFGTEEQWNEIEILDGNDPLLNAKFKFNFHYHIAVVDKAVEPTCTETGLTEGSHCGICNEVLVAQVEVEALGHSEVIDEAVAPTCAKTGLTEGSHCGVCNEILVAQVEVGLLDHKLVDYVCKDCGYNYYTEGLEFTLNEAGTAYSVAKGTVSSTEIIIPSIYKGLPVETIPNEAFSRCENIEKVIIPNSVTSIGYSAFYECSSLKSISLPFTGASLNDSQYQFFGYIFGSRYDYENGAFLPECLTEVIITSGETISAKAFYRCVNITNIVFPESIKTISDEAFSGCKSLTNIVVPDTVTSIGYSAFEGCENLASITLPFIGNTLNGTENTHFGYIFGAYDSYSHHSSIPSSLKEVIITVDGTAQKNSFFNCMDVEIVKGISSIGENAFQGCSSLKEFYFKGTIEDWCKVKFTSETSQPKYYASNVFMLDENDEYYEFEELVLPDSVTEVGNYQFYNFSSLKSVVIPNTVTRIGKNSFAGCSSLESITFPFVGEKAEEGSNNYFGYIFGALAYYQNSDFVPTTIKEVVITNATTIYENAFDSCSEITTIILPTTLETINNYAFSNCSSLLEMEIPSSVTTIGISAFSGCTSLTKVDFPENVTTLSDRLFANCSSLAEFEISEKVTTIGFNTFEGCSSLKVVVIPNNVTEIGKSAFENCNAIEKITVPFVGYRKDKVGNINFGYIFGASNDSDNDSYVPSSLKEVIITNETLIGEYAFYDCISIEKVVINEGVTEISQYAFYGCSSLKNVVIPVSVELFGDAAFSNCQLENIYYTGTEEEWGYIQINPSSMTYQNIIYNYIVE